MSSPFPSHLVCVFCVSAGKNGENLGTDEEQIVQLVFLLYDTTNNKVVAVQEFSVRPGVDDDVTEPVLTEECKQTTGLTEKDAKNGQSLEQVIDEVDRFLRTKEVHPDQGGNTFCLCTDGPLHLRMTLHPEAFQKNISLAPYFFKYYDLRKQFRHFYKPERIVSTLEEMLSFLSLEADQSAEYGVRHCQDMAHVINRLITDGHRFHGDPELIMDRLQPGILNKGEEIDDDTIVKARGLPWQSTEQDIVNFFRGLNVTKGGVALCLSPQGRRNGEALVRFESSEQRSLALRRHKHHLGQRYVEVYKATARDYISVAGGNREAQAFLSHQSWNGTQIIVRMRGLPYSCKAEQVIQFFGCAPNGVDVLDGEEGVLFVHQADGRATGDAFVLFASEDEANRALTKHKQLIGTRYIELFKSTTAEVQQVLNRSLDPRASILSPKDATSLLSAAALVPSLVLPHLPGFPAQQIIPGGALKDCIRLRGLPPEAQVGEIIQFLGDMAHEIVCQGIHLIYKADGSPSGEAFIQMQSEAGAKSASVAKHNRTMFLPNKKRNIEVLQCSGDEMTIILNNGLADTLSPIPTATLSPLPSSGTLGPAAAAAFWAPNPCGAAAVVNGGAVGLQSRSAIVETVPTFFQSAVLASPSNALAQSPAFVYPTGQLPLHAASVLPGVVPAASGAASPSLPQALPSPLPGNAFPGQVIAFQQLPVRQPAPVHVAPPLTAFQPMVYWYPTTATGAAAAGATVPSASLASSHGALYLPLGPASVAVKGLPPSAQVHDVLAFLEGSFENLPDVQLQRGPDGRPTGEAIVTFLSRSEAERAVSDKNRKICANHIVEVRSI